MLWGIGIMFTLGLILVDIVESKEKNPWYVEVGIVLLAIIMWPLILGIGTAHTINSLLDKD